jgi:ribosomal-protein-alanine N-acetyltransferase
VIHLISSVLPNIKTERTVVRLAEKRDRDAVLAYYLANQERLTPYTPTWPDGFFTKQFWEKQIDLNVAEFYAECSVRMFVFDGADAKRCIGNISLSGILRNAAQFCYLGYGIDGQCEGQGLMRESVGAVVHYAFTSLNLHRVMANYMPDNERSGTLLKRLGFVVEGQARDYLLLNGAWQDHVMTAITNPDWQPF